LLEHSIATEGQVLPYLQPGLTIFLGFSKPLLGMAQDETW